MDHSLKKSKFIAPQKASDQLNDWNYVNPSNSEDLLPQPYRAIDKIIQEDILRGVYSQIFEIEKYKNDANYEGHLKTLPPQGSFDITHVTCVCRDNTQTNHNHVIAGDAFGSIMILDLNKKMKVAKKEVGTGRRIRGVALGCRDLSTDEAQNVQSVAVIAHLDPTVYIYRYRLGENKLFLHHTIPIGKEETNPKSVRINDMPTDVQFSLYSQFLMITQFSGNVLIFRIPDFNIMKPPEEEKLPTQPSSVKLKTQPGIPSPQTKPTHENKATSSHSNSITSQLDIKSTPINEVFYKVTFKGIKKEVKYLDMISSLRQEYAPPVPEVPTKEEKTKAPVSKDKKVEEVAPPPVDDFEVNPLIDIEPTRSEDGLDITIDYPTPRFSVQTYFIHETLGLGTGMKTFNQLKRFEVVVGLIVSWTHTSAFEVHMFQATNKYNLPDFVQVKPPSASTQKSVDGAVTAPHQQMPQLGNPPQPKFTASSSSIKTIYPISALAVSQSSSFVALGLVQGSIIILELSTLQEKYYLDKHQAAVSHLLFCDDWRLVSAASDGSVHIYDLLDQGKLVMKRTNQFRKSKQLTSDPRDPGIAFLGVSSSGVAVALDNQEELRMYDVWHGEKIAKLTAQQIMDEKKRCWSLWPRPVMLCSKQEIIIIADSFESKTGDVEEMKTKWTKNTCVQIFKIFDNLINLFPALSNVYRRGIDKEKIIHLYSKIDGASLRDPSFEVPTLSGLDPQNLLAVPMDAKSPSKSRRSVQVKDPKHDTSHHSNNHSIGHSHNHPLTKIKEEPAHKVPTFFSKTISHRHPSSTHFMAPHPSQTQILTSTLPSEVMPQSSLRIRMPKPRTI